MIKKLILLSLCLFILSGCTSPSRDELLDYVNVKIPAINDLEQAAILEYEKAINNKEYTYSDLYDTLNEIVIPKYTEFYNKLNNITLNTDEVKEIHDLYKAAAKIQLDALLVLEEGFNNKDTTKIAEANNMIKDSKNKMNDFKLSTIKLADTYKIKYILE